MSPRNVKVLIRQRNLLRQRFRKTIKKSTSLKFMKFYNTWASFSAVLFKNKILHCNKFVSYLSSLHSFNFSIKIHNIIKLGCDTEIKIITMAISSFLIRLFVHNIINIKVNCAKFHLWMSWITSMSSLDRGIYKLAQQCSHKSWGYGDIVDHSAVSKSKHSITPALVKVKNINKCISLQSIR